jgi:hypothetical protein
LDKRRLIVALVQAFDETAMIANITGEAKTRVDKITVCDNGSVETPSRLPSVPEQLSV